MNTTERRHSIFSLKRWRRLPALVPLLLALLAKLYRRTFRLRINDPAGLLRKDRLEPVVFVLWHNRILFLADCFPRRHRRAAAVLVSASRDGEYAAAFIRHFGLGVVRGSSSRGGREALWELKRCLDSGTAVVITLDGPRGPRYVVHAGAAFLARVCGAPIVPIMLNAPSRWELRSWDRTQIPKPFSTVELRIGAPVTFPPATGTDDRQSVCAALRAAVLAVTDDGT